jgi:hypothetical protein
MQVTVDKYQPISSSFIGRLLLPSAQVYRFGRTKIQVCDHATLRHKFLWKNSCANPVIIWMRRAAIGHVFK